jgi:cytosine/adenosine deaminase-related metal-dependent hydrolase
VCDVGGAWVLPGLVNAHDHLELNHYGPQHGGAPFRNVSEWVDHMRPRLQADAGLAAGRARPLMARLFAGGLKNLLSGVTLVAHHNPMYPGLHRVSPVRVLSRFGWAHSLAMAGEPVGARGEPGGEVGAMWRATPRRAPFIVHVAEGVDAAARSELAVLDAVGALAGNTVLVHALAIDAAGWRLAASRGASVVWCPASNLALFGATLDAAQVIRACAGRVALGTDSRLTGSRDLLDELGVAAQASTLTSGEKLALVTTAPAAVLRAAPAGRLEEGVPADLVVLPPRPGDAGDVLASCRRSDLQLVVNQGQPRIGAAAFDRAFRARRVTTSELCVDGAPRLADAGLVRAMRQFAIEEPGVELGQ